MPKKSNTRAAQGAGTIRQRPDGRWEARYTLGRNPGTGRQVQKSVYGATQKEVRQRLQQIAVSISEGTYMEPSKMTVGEWLDVWHAEYLNGVKPNTVITYGQQIKNHIAPALGAVQLRSLNGTQIQRFYNQMHKGGLSPKTIKNVHGVLHSALKQALKLGYIRVNPCDSCTLPRVEKAEIQPLDAPELRRFLDAIKGHRFEALYLVDLFTGMREGEILGLQWQCVDFEKGTITVNKQLHRPREKGAAYRFGPPKNDKPRIITPAPFVLEVLKERKRRQAADRIKAGPLWNDCGFPDLVFTGETGRFLCYNPIAKALKCVLRELGIQERRFHDLRHTYAVASLQAGDDIKTVQENLGHHSAAFTMDTYAHVTETMKQASAARMEAFIQNVKNGY